MDKSYFDELIGKYGRDLESTPIPALKAIANAKKAANIDPEYQYFTEIVARSKTKISSSYALQSWIRNRNTIEFLSLRERKNNPFFSIG